MNVQTDVTEDRTPESGSTRRRGFLNPTARRYLVCIFISICVYIPFLFFTQPVRVGDGSEYYAMAVAWSETHRPFMTETGWKYYDQLYRSNAIPGISGTESLRGFAPELTTNGGQDFPHFWFYSLGAAVIAEMADYAGINIPIHNPFLLWHCALLALLLVIAMREYGWRGLLAALLLTFLSPAFWYLDKVHTEFFTFTLTTSAVILFTRRKYLPAALLLALTATQNISFSLISVFVLGLWIYTKRNSRWKTWEIVQSLAVLLINALHPAYYLLRHGALSPQFLSGGAQTGLNLSRFWIWWLDPDVGLLPNWWFGVLIIILALIIGFQRKWKFAGVRLWILLIFVYLTVSLLAQSSTVNLNSGASPGPSRYVVWYLALFFPALLLLLQSAGKTHLSTMAFVLVVLLAGSYSMRHFLPSLVGVAHCQPSTSSYWIQKNLPWLYDPPLEIFAERYGGACEPILSIKNIAVIGPDCRKVLVLNHRDDAPFTITGASGCRLDFEQISKLVTTKLDSATWPEDGVYYRLSREETSTNVFSPQTGIDYPLAFANTLTQAVGADYRSWGLFEDWGVWTVGETSTLIVPCPKDVHTISNLEVMVQPFVTDTHPAVTASIQIDGQQAWSGTLTGPQTISLSLQADTCKSNDNMTMRIVVDNPLSRANLGISGDNRKLGIGFIRLRFLNH